MPITSGNYVTPAWKDQAAPPINDDELNAMSSTLEGSQILVGSGAPTSSTSGKIGQRYADISTTPPTMYQCVSGAGSTYVWKPKEDPNANTARPYSTGSSYAAGDYCIREGRLWRALEATSGTWDGEKWERAWYADGLSGHVSNRNNPHNVTAAQTGAVSPAILATVQTNTTAARNYAAGDYFLYQEQLYEVKEAVAQGGELFGEPPKSEATALGDGVAALYPKRGTVTLGTSWSGAGPYAQTVTVSGAAVTAKSKIDLLPTAEQLAQLAQDDVTGIIVDNSGGTLTAYAIGAQPSAAMTVKCIVEETI
jgi:hypothetical protein